MTEITGRPIPMPLVPPGGVPDHVHELPSAHREDAPSDGGASSQRCPIPYSTGLGPVDEAHHFEATEIEVLRVPSDSVGTGRGIFCVRCGEVRRLLITEPARG